MIIVILGTLATYFLVKNGSEYTNRESVVPESVSLYLSTDFDEGQKPFLGLSVYAGSGCDKVSELNISKVQKEGTMFVAVEGYSVQDYTGSGTCSAVVTEARAEIEIDGFLQYRGHQVLFRLGDKESRYSVSRDKYAVYLEPIEVTNVISHELGTNQPEEPESIALILNSKNFAVLGLNGAYREEIDYRDQLRAFAKSNGFSVVDEIYRGFDQDTKNQLWVLVEGSQIPEMIPEVVDKITYDSGGWGPETVGVSIVRKTPPPSYAY